MVDTIIVKNYLVFDLSYILSQGVTLLGFLGCGEQEVLSSLRTHKSQVLVAILTFLFNTSYFDMHTASYLFTYLHVPVLI